nr:unnamed protein product [Trichobilharzia regenti]
MIYFKCCAQTTCSEEYLICILLILCSIFNVQSHSDNTNNNNNEINNALKQSVNIDSSVLNPELIRMKKEAESSLDNNNNNNNDHNNRISDIEHIEHNGLDILTDHLNNANKVNTDNNDINNINDDDLLKSLSNMIGMYHRFPNTERNNDDNNNERSGTTFTFIEMIVQRTVNKYMNVIRTRSDWLKRLLQLVKEERDIRSRYNCYTDACIYKIQLFTTQLKAHLLRNTVHLEGNHAGDELHLKRFRRSSLDKSLTPPQSSPAEGVAQAAAKAFDLNDSTVEILHDDPAIPDALLIHPSDHGDEHDDDALRLPNELHKLNILKKHSENAHDDGDIDKADNNHFASWTNNNDSRQKSIKFDNTHKIDVARFSQDLVNGVLSKHTKSQTVTVPTVTKMATTTDMFNPIIRNDSSINISPLPVSTPQPNLFAQMSGEENPFLQNHEDDVNSDPEGVGQLDEMESSTNIADKVPSISADHELKRDEVSGTIVTDGANSISLSPSSSSGESEVEKEEKGAIADAKGETLPLPLFESAAYTTDIPTAFSDAMPTSDLVAVKAEELPENTPPPPPQSSSPLPTFTTTTTTTADIRQTDIYSHSMKPSLNIRAISLTVEETLVIPFGLNKFNGRPYENCTGQYETYCYNAIKCVYISVLETAAC